MSRTSFSLIFLLLASVLCLQVVPLKLKSSQTPFHVARSLNKVLEATQFPHLLQTTMKTSPTQALATLFTYYIDGRVLDNLISSLFDQYQENNVVPYDKLLQVLREEGVDEDGLPRVLQLVSLDENEDADFTEFRQMSHVIFNEALSVITYAYIVRNHKDGLYAKVDLETVENGIFKIFHKLKNLYPEPRCEEIEFLFEKSDKDQDCFLNIQEFHYLLSIFLKYYRAGIQNNEYANIIFHDNVFADLWLPEKSSEPTSETIDGVTEPDYYSEPSSEPVTESDVTIWHSPSSETIDSITESDEGAEPESTESDYVTQPEVTEATPESDATEYAPPTYNAPTESTLESDATEPEPETTEVTPSSEPVTESDDVTERGSLQNDYPFGFFSDYPPTEETQVTEATPTYHSDALTESAPESDATEPETEETGATEGTEPTDQVVE